MEMAKFTVKTKLDNVIQVEDGSFSYNQEIVSMQWKEWIEDGEDIQENKDGIGRETNTFLHSNKTH